MYICNSYQREAVLLCLIPDSASVPQMVERLKGQLMCLIVDLLHISMLYNVYANDICCWNLNIAPLLIHHY